MDINSVLNAVLGAVLPILTDYPVLPVYFFTFTLVYGIGIIFLRGSSERISEGLRIYTSQSGKIDDLLIKAGSGYNTNKCIILISMTFIFLVFAGLILFLRTGNIRLFVFCILAALAAAACFWPREYIFKDVHSPFFIILNRQIKNKREKLERELFSSVITLKNLSIIREEEPLSADVIFEKLMNASSGLKPVYARMLNLYRQGESEEAFKYFASMVGTKNGGTLALTLSKIDRINPGELKSQVESLIEIMSEERYTKGIIEAERKGNITFALATTVCFIMSINLVMICVLIDALSSLGELI